MEATGGDINTEIRSNIIATDGDPNKAVSHASIKPVMKAIELSSLQDGTGRERQTAPYIFV